VGERRARPTHRRLPHGGRRRALAGRPLSIHFANGELDRVETARLVLRKPTRADLAELHRIHADPATYEHSPESIHADLATSREFLRRWLAHWRDYGFGYWVVEHWALEHRGEVIGFGGLWLMPNWRRLGDVLNVYYRFQPEAWGHGYASEMVAAALELVPGLPAVARVHPDNVPSQRVALRAGFERRPDLDDPDLVVFARGLD
jgi:RimJ/RimL family protein N-acetyltransferase